MDAKRRAAEAALDYLRDGMVVGLGSGSTARQFIDALGQTLRRGRLKHIRCVPTSVESDRQARQDGLPVAPFDSIDAIDITIDGADEIAPDLTLIKGLGGALLREKIVAQNSRRLVIIADSSKLVSRLGTHSPLPVEVLPFGHEANARFLRGLGCTPTLRTAADGKIFITDNGNYIYDCRFPGIDEPAPLNEILAHRAGIIETGLFIGIADTAIVADDASLQTMNRPQ